MVSMRALIRPMFVHSLTRLSLACFLQVLLLQRVQRGPTHVQLFMDIHTDIYSYVVYRLLCIYDHICTCICTYIYNVFFNKKNVGLLGQVPVASPQTEPNCVNVKGLVRDPSTGAGEVYIKKAPVFAGDPIKG